MRFGMSLARRQLVLFFTALQFYTRIPAPEWVVYHPDNLSRATGYLPLVGWLAGAVSGGVLLGALYLFNVNVAVLLSMAASVLLTGAFHEDGFADVCDGFGGGWTRAKILEIMKDSRLGTYAVIGLILILGLKFALTTDITVLGRIPLMLSLITAHSLSRLMPVFVIYALPYARDTEDSKAKPVASKPDIRVLVTAIIFGLLPLFVFSFWQRQFVLLACPVWLASVTWLLARYFRKWIGGYTGDCLGAIQQVCEIGFYLFLTAIWRFI